MVNRNKKENANSSKFPYKWSFHLYANSELEITFSTFLGMEEEEERGGKEKVVVGVQEKTEKEKPTKCEPII